MANTRPALPQSDLFLTYRSCVLIIGSFCAVAEHLCDTYLESEHQQDTYSYLCRTVRTWVCESPREVAVQRSCDRPRKRTLCADPGPYEHIGACADHRSGRPRPLEPWFWRVITQYV